MMTLAIALAGLLAATVILAGLHIYNLKKRAQRKLTRLQLELRDARMNTWQLIVLLEEALDQRDPGAPLDGRMVAILDHLLATATQPDTLRHWHALPAQTKIIFRFYIAGHTQAQIAHALDLTRDQVRTHLKNACQALDADDIRQAAALAGRYGLLDDDRRLTIDD